MKVIFKLSMEAFQGFGFLVVLRARQRAPLVLFGGVRELGRRIGEEYER